VWPPTLSAATPVGAAITSCLSVRQASSLSSVDFPVPALPVTKMWSRVFSMRSKTACCSGARAKSDIAGCCTLFGSGKTPTMIGDGQEYPSIFGRSCLRMASVNQVPPAQPQSMPPAPQQTPRPSDPARTRFIIIWVIVGVMFLGAAASAVGSLQRTVYGARGTVTQYLDALE